MSADYRTVSPVPFPQKISHIPNKYTWGLKESWSWGLDKRGQEWYPTRSREKWSETLSSQTIPTCTHWTVWNKMSLCSECLCCVFPISYTIRYCRKTWLWRTMCRRWSCCSAKTKWSWRDSDRFGRFAASSDLKDWKSCMCAWLCETESLCVQDCCCLELLKQRSSEKLLGLFNLKTQGLCFSLVGQKQRCVEVIWETLPTACWLALFGSN